MNKYSWGAQRPVYTRLDLKNDMESILTEGVPMAKGGGPDMSMIRKASSQLDRLMALIDAYSPPR